MKRTKIEWCDATWNPVTGCFHDCPYCYAGKIAKRFSYEGQTLDAPIDLQETWVKDKRGLDPGLYVLQHEVRLKENGRVVPYPFRFCPTFHRYKLDEPIRQKQPHKIFVCSMADLFGKWVPDEWIEEVFEACEAASQHNYLFLTKNPARYVQLSDAGKLPSKSKMWFGTTVTTDEQEFYYNNGFLNWSHSFISIEPIMGHFAELNGSKPEWVIVGAETGNRKGRITPERSWIENLAEQCSKYEVPIFMKDSLASIVGEENMRREFPKELS